jgi:hypothetical protein
MYTIYNNYTDAELLRIVAGCADAQPITRELAQRLEDALEQLEKQEKADGNNS